MKPVPKRMRPNMEDGAVSRGMFFAEKNRYAKSEFSPQYMSVANDIIKRIFDGEYRPASKLPSMRMLAKKYGVSVQVVLSALQGLQALHYIESKPKCGVFVSTDIRPARFYRIGVFVLNQNPFAYGGLLYNLNNDLTKAGYSVIIGTNYDGGFRLKQWVAHKRNLDGLIVFGVPSPKEVDHFTRLHIPYILLSAPLTPMVGVSRPEVMSLFSGWFLSERLDKPAEMRPVFLFESGETGVHTPGAELDDYHAENIYGFERGADNTLAVVKF